MSSTWLLPTVKVPGPHFVDLQAAVADITLFFWRRFGHLTCRIPHLDISFNTYLTGNLKHFWCPKPLNIGVFKTHFFGCFFFFLLRCLPSVCSHVQLSVTPWIVAHQAPLSMGLSRQEYWSELPFPTPGNLPNPGIKPKSLASPALAGRFFTFACACLCSQLLPLCLTRCYGVELARSFVLGILQARILEWVAMPSSRGSSSLRDRHLCILHCRQILDPVSHLESIFSTRTPRF